MASDEPVTSPDQHKPTVSGRKAAIGAIVTIIALVAMSFGENGWEPVLYLYGTAGTVAPIMLISWLLRKNGLRSH